ncbi:MAG: phosphoribosyltransferase [Asgard group archaeon]|nr:phosphoribosyltransferase [Asgard group archaeon]
MTTEIVVLNYEAIWKDLFQLAEMVLADYQPDVLIGISRGGLVVTRLLSDIMDNKNVAVFGVGFYTGINETAKKPIITQELCYEITNKRVLLVDDVADSGLSLEFAREYLQKKSPAEIKIATIHYKPQSVIKPDFYLEKISKWLVYPWEYLEFAKLYYLQQQQKGCSEEDIQKELLNLQIPSIVIENAIKKIKTERK